MDINRRRDKPIASTSIILSPQRVPSPPKAKSRRKKACAPTLDHNIYDKLMNDPEKKRMILQLLHDNRAIIQEHQKKEQGTSSPINNLKTKPTFESPSALKRLKQLEEQRKQNKSNTMTAADYERKLMESLALTPMRKPVKKTLLKDVVAFVEVRHGSYDRSDWVKALLLRMGAKISDVLTNKCTHLIFKDGEYTTFEKAKQLKLPVVSILWLDVMDRTGFKAPTKLYPALGDPETKKICDTLCEELYNKHHGIKTNNTSKVKNSRRKTLSASQSFDLDKYLDIHDDEDDSSDFIASSQPEPNITLNQTRRILQFNSPVSSHTKKINRKTNSILTDSPSNAADASFKLSETLLNSPHINKRKKAGNNNDKTGIGADKENSPGDIAGKGKDKKSLFKQITKRKQTRATNVFDSPLAASPTSEKSPEENKIDELKSSTPVRRRRTLLHPEMLGIVMNETNACTVSMDITIQRLELTKKLTETPAKNYKNENQRITNNFCEDMEITGNDNKIDNTGIDNQHQVNTMVNMHVVDKPVDEINNPNPVKTVVVDRTSISSTNTSKSDDLSAFTARRLTRRTSVFLEKSNKDLVNIDETNKSKMHETTEIVEKADGSNVQGLSQPEIPVIVKKNKTPKDNNKSLDLDVSTVSTRRITRRMSRMISVQDDIDTEMSPLQLSDSRSGSHLSKSNTKYSSSVDLSLRISEKSSSVPSLRISDGSTSSASGTSSKRSSDEGLELIETNKQNGATKVSPVTNLSQKFSQTTISTKQHPVESTNADEQTLNETYATASTCYSMLDANSKISSREQSSQSVSTLPDSSKSTCAKRKLYNPDDKLDESKGQQDNNENERQERIQETQTTMKTDLKRKVLERRLSSLNIPDVKGKEGRGGTKRNQRKPLIINEQDDDSDQEFTTQPTPVTQPITTQTQSKKKRFIVCTRFHSDQIPNFKSIVDELGGFKIEQNVSSMTTHLVAMEASRTLNFVRAMSRGIWILRSDWLFDSQKAGEWLDEESYEMTEFSPLVQQLRLQRVSFGKAFCHDVFINCGAIYISNTCHPPPRPLQELVELCKGEVTMDLNKAKIIIGRIEDTSVQMLTSQVCVQEKWVLDSISFGRCKKFNNYVIDQL